MSQIIEINSSWEIEWSGRICIGYCPTQAPRALRIRFAMSENYPAEGIVVIEKQIRRGCATGGLARFGLLILIAPIYHDFWPISPICLDLLAKVAVVDKRRNQWPQCLVVFVIGPFTCCQHWFCLLELLLVHFTLRSYVRCCHWLEATKSCGFCAVSVGSYNQGLPGSMFRMCVSLSCGRITDDWWISSLICERL